MASQLDVTKLALQALDERFDNVTATDNDLPGVEQITLVFDEEFEMLLVEHPWIFSLRYELREEPTDVSDDIDFPPHWSVVLPYPNNALKVWELLNPLGRDYPPIPFKSLWIDYDNDGTDEHILMCNSDEVMAVSTVSTVDITDAGNHFVKALALRLAARVCLAVTSSVSLKATLEQQAELMVHKAAAEEASAEGVDVDRDQDPDWIRARG